MPRLPVLSGREALRAFERDRWTFARQQGSHLIMEKDGIPENLSIPNDRELAKGTLRNLIKTAGLTRRQFMELLRR